MGTSLAVVTPSAPDRRPSRAARLIYSARRKPPPDPPRLLDVDEAAELLGLHRRTVERMIRSGELHAVRFGARVKVRADELAKLIDEHTDR